VLGALQGLTEFLPVSSTAHLLLAPELLGIPLPADPAQRHAFVTIIQVGTLLPALLYFWRDWWAMLRAALRLAIHRQVKEPADRLVLHLIYATIPAVVAGVLVEKFVEGLADVEHRPTGKLVVGLALVGFGLVMWWVDRRASRHRTTDHMVAADAWFVGCAQALALIPGVSRSGATITAGLVAGFTREDAARFSFLLYAPVMAGATGWKLLKLARDPAALPAAEWMRMGIATLAAAVVGYLCIAFLLRWLRTRSLDLFVFWRALVGVLLLGMYFLQH